MGEYYKKFNTPNGEFSISTQRLRSKIIGYQKDMVDFLSTNTIQWSDILELLNSDAQNALIKIGRMGDLDCGFNENKGKYCSTIVGLEDCTDGFIGIYLPIIGSGDNPSQSIVDLHRKIKETPDFIVRDLKTGKGYRNILYDQSKKQYYKKEYKEYKK